MDGSKLKLVMAVSMDPYVKAILLNLLPLESIFLEDIQYDLGYTQGFYSLLHGSF